MADTDGKVASSQLALTLVLIFCCGHAAFLIYSMIPVRFSHRIFDSPALAVYEQLFAGRQQWIMFDTIPVHRTMNVRLERFNKDGGKEVAGCVLPGFKPYPQPEDVRYQGLFYRVLFSAEDTDLRDAYLRNAARVLSARANASGSGDWSVVVEAEFTRNLVHMRRDKQMAVPIVKSYALSTHSEETR